MTAPAHPGLLALLCMVSAAGSALGQSYVRPPCPAGDPPAFVDALQPRWYRRFWTGECRDLPSLRCKRGRPYWNDFVRTLAARAPANRRAEVQARACRLGRQIGFEWTRPSAVRRIDTHELRRLDAALENAPDVLSGLTAVEARVRQRTER